MGSAIATQTQPLGAHLKLCQSQPLDDVETSPRQLYRVREELPSVKAHQRIKARWNHLWEMHFHRMWDMKPERPGVWRREQEKTIVNESIKTNHMLWTPRSLALIPVSLTGREPFTKHSYHPQNCDHQFYHMLS